MLLLEDRHLSLQVERTEAWDSDRRQVLRMPTSFYVQPIVQSIRVNMAAWSRPCHITLLASFRLATGHADQATAGLLRGRNDTDGLDLRGIVTT